MGRLELTGGLDRKKTQNRQQKWQMIRAVLHMKDYSALEGRSRGEQTSKPVKWTHSVVVLN